MSISKSQRKAYDKYKSSNFNWLAKIPSEWKMCRNIGLFSERIERAIGDEELLSVSISRGVTLQSELEGERDISNEDKSNYKIVKPGDIVYNKMRMWQGAVGVSKLEGIVSPAYIVLKPRNAVYPNYFHYLYRTQVYNELSYQYGHGIADDQHSLRYWQFKGLYSCLPSYEVQKKIAAFLDGRTRLIDRLIAKKEKLIELLHERRNTIITQAVTMGLDPNTRKKACDVEWLGNIPQNWEIRKLKYLVRNITKKRGNNNEGMTVALENSYFLKDKQLRVVS